MHVTADHTTGSKHEEHDVTNIDRHVDHNRTALADELATRHTARSRLPFAALLAAAITIGAVLVASITAGASAEGCPPPSAERAETTSVSDCGGAHRHRPEHPDDHATSDARGG